RPEGGRQMRSRTGVLRRPVESVPDRDLRMEERLCVEAPLVAVVLGLDSLDLAALEVDPPGLQHCPHHLQSGGVGQPATLVYEAGEATTVGSPAAVLSVATPLLHPGQELLEQPGHGEHVSGGDLLFLDVVAKLVLG